MGTKEAYQRRWTRGELARVMEEAKRIFGTHTSRKNLLERAQMVLPEDRRHTPMSLGVPSTTNTKIFSAAKEHFEKKRHLPPEPEAPVASRVLDVLQSSAPIEEKARRLEKIGKETFDFETRPIPAPEPIVLAPPVVEAPSLKLTLELPQMTQVLNLLQEFKTTVTFLAAQVEAMEKKLHALAEKPSMPFAGSPRMVVERPKEPEKVRLPVVAVYGFLSNQATELARRLGTDSVRLRYVDKNRTRIRVDCDFVLLNTKFIDHSIEKYVKTNYDSSKILLYSGGIEEGERLIRHTLKMPSVGEATRTS